MLSVTRFRYAFTPRLSMGLLTLLSMALFISLGFWQLQRADEKKALLLAQKQALHKAPVSWSYQDALPSPHQLITVHGRFLSPVILLDNQHEQHQFGYHVLSPFILANHHVILVDRGWLIGEPTRSQFPQVETPLQPLQLEGTAYYPSKKQWVLGHALEIKQPNLAIAELLDPELISQFLHKPVYPFIIRLNETASYGYTRTWRVVNMPPERHMAYAFQWFAIASVILVLFITLNLKKT